MQNQSQNARPMNGSGNFPAPVQRQPMQPIVPASRSGGLLRTIATLGMPGLVILFFLGLMQVFAPYDWKPTVMIGKAIAQYEVTVIQDTLVDKAKAEEMIAAARAEGERQAEIAFQIQLKELEFTYQEKFATVQAQLQTGMDAYKSLYERANLIQQAVMNMEGTLLQYKQQAISSTHGGKALVANVADVGCLFSPELCQVGETMRRNMADELNYAARQGAGQIGQDYLRDMPDPAQLQGQLMLPPPAM